MENALPAETIELLTFCLAQQKYGLNIKSVREIRGWTQTTPLPQAPRAMVGVVNLRGSVLPVMNLALRLGLEDREWTARNVIIVVETHGTILGLLVDSVLDIVTLPKTELQPAPHLTEIEASSVLSALAVHEEEMLRVLELDHIVVQAVAAA